MAIDWDAELLQPVMSVFGEGSPADQSTWPIYLPDGGRSFPLPDAVFDEEYRGVSIEGDVDATQSRPVLGVRLSLFQIPPRQNDQVFIPSVNKTFIVSDVHPDGHRWAKLLLMIKG